MPLVTMTPPFVRILSATEESDDARARPMHASTRAETRTCAKQQYYRCLSLRTSAALLAYTRQSCARMARASRRGAGALATHEPAHLHCSDFSAQVADLPDKMELRCTRQFFSGKIFYSVLNSRIDVGQEIMPSRLCGPIPLHLVRCGTGWVARHLL